MQRESQVRVERTDNRQLCDQTETPLVKSKFAKKILELSSLYSRFTGPLL